MDILIVCGSPGPGGPEYAMAFMLGLLLDLAMWVHHRHVARRPAARAILPIR